MSGLIYYKGSNLVEISTPAFIGVVVLIHAIVFIAAQVGGELSSLTFFPEPPPLDVFKGGVVNITQVSVIQVYSGPREDPGYETGTDGQHGRP